MHLRSAPVALLLCMCSLPLSAQQPMPPDVGLPSEVRGKVGEFIVIRAAAGNTTVRWILLDEGPSFLPPELLKDGRTAVIFGLRPGTFRILAYSAHNGEPTPPSICKVIIGDGPGPAPPTPPPPPPPKPTDPLVQKFQAAYKASPEGVPIKAKQRDLLIGLYAAMADHARDKTILATGDLLADLRKTSAQMLDQAVLVELRKMIAAEIGAVLGTGVNTALDPDLRPKAVDVFAKIARALEQVK